MMNPQSMMMAKQFLPKQAYAPPQLSQQQMANAVNYRQQQQAAGQPVPTAATLPQFPLSLVTGGSASPAYNAQQAAQQPPGMPKPPPMTQQPIPPGGVPPPPPNPQAQLAAQQQAQRAAMMSQMSPGRNFRPRPM